MAAALALGRIGRRVHLLEQAAEFGEVGAGLQIGPNVMKVLDRLGVMDQIEQVAFLPDNLILMDAIEGVELTRISLGKDFRARFTYPYATLHRADLHSILTAACAEQDLVTLSTGSKIVGFTQDGDGVEVQLASGEVIAGSVLIGADGLWSATRQQIVGDGDPRVTGHVAYRAVLPTDEIPEDLRSTSVVLWGGPDLHLAHYPMRRGELFNIGAIFHSRRFQSGANDFGDPEELHEHFQGVCPPVQALLGKIDEWRMWALRDREPVPNWTDRRVTLLGDAAHPTLQYLAQGAGMAIEDAWTLAREVASVADPAEAFETYQDLRIARTARITLFSRLYGEVYHAKGVSRLVRAQMLQGWSDAKARDSLAWIYDGI
jgi:salicylate hydroxylase